MTAACVVGVALDGEGALSLQLASDTMAKVTMILINM
tara:strand:- start:377 stop:487 length:111 start_codon:yes stop_codon:yes gene_type:complete